MRNRAGWASAAVATVVAALALVGAAQATTFGSQVNVAGVGRPSAATRQHVRTRLPLRAQTFALYTSSSLSALADGISGWPLTVDFEDDPAEWAYYFGAPADVLGFACIYQTDPYDLCYHRIFIGPAPTVTFINWFNGLAPTYSDAAVAIMTLTHEAMHYKLFSADEGRVNACALQEFPSVIDTYFGIHPTVTTMVPVKIVVWKTKRVWVWRHGRRVRIAKRVKVVKVVNQERIVSNPDYVNLVLAAKQFHDSQPPPYNSTYCW
jgi:hypothetical protein